MSPKLITSRCALVVGDLDRAAGEYLRGRGAVHVVAARERALQALVAERCAMMPQLDLRIVGDTISSPPAR